MAFKAAGMVRVRQCGAVAACVSQERGSPVQAEFQQAGGRQATAVCSGSVWQAAGENAGGRPCEPRGGSRCRRRQQVAAGSA